jgi:hypothetical protein
VFAVKRMFLYLKCTSFADMDENDDILHGNFDDDVDLVDLVADIDLIVDLQVLISCNTVLLRKGFSKQKLINFSV